MLGFLWEIVVLLVALWLFGFVLHIAGSFIQYCAASRDRAGSVQLCDEP